MASVVIQYKYFRFYWLPEKSAMKRGSYHTSRNFRVIKNNAQVLELLLLSSSCIENYFMAVCRLEMWTYTFLFPLKIKARQSWTETQIIKFGFYFLTRGEQLFSFSVVSGKTFVISDVFLSKIFYYLLAIFSCSQIFGKIQLKLKF